MFDTFLLVRPCWWMEETNFDHTNFFSLCVSAFWFFVVARCGFAAGLSYVSPRALLAPVIPAGTPCRRSAADNFELPSLERLLSYRVLVCSCVRQAVSSRLQGRTLHKCGAVRTLWPSDLLCHFEICNALSIFLYINYHGHYTRSTVRETLEYC